MNKNNKTSLFQATLLQPALSETDEQWAFVVLPKEVSETLPRRGKTSIEGTINGHEFTATLDPDGQLSHWLKLDQHMLKVAGLVIGDLVTFDIKPMEQEPEPEVPTDLAQALAADPVAKTVWNDTTTIARLDWIHWIISAKQTKTRDKRINDACSMLASGKRRVCCFDPSGFYSKALKAPKQES
ncbi:YdeI/OmpD-associated family protein [Psychrosphaera sp. F3M07]|uniref:YdeI/OmpD-associated family protein n=1 Tax=Psychrosphaera sp. F3M07 TaxID=2841560 RepID=UPI001C0918D1|nr:YdeI/OmpD-associated family protein [Psychrosphaera sp. F3M07]MBU2917353.1 YdeI/OmpD-associated family protein [Psychrosphaera sp. F3M07]